MMKKLVFSSFLFISSILLVFESLQAQEQKIFHSKFLNKADTVWIFTPKDYANNMDQSVPVLYMLHGWSGNYRHWDLMIDCQKYADEYKLMIVCPDGLYDSWYVNSPVANENQYEDFFFKDLFPYVKQHYRVDTSEVFITGLSMGGHGALFLYEDHPELFKSAGSLSGVLELTDWGDHYELDRVLGLNEDKTKDDSMLWNYSVMSRLPVIEKSGKAIIVSCGTEDPFYSINTRFVDSCRKYNIDVTFDYGPGTHNSNYWRREVKNHFDFFKGIMDKVKK